MMFTHLPFMWFLVFLIFVVAVANALESGLAVSYSNASQPGLQGSTASFVCSWSFNPTAGEIATQLVFSSTNRQKIYTYTIGNSFNLPPVKNAGFINSRMTIASPDVSSGGAVGSVTLSLSQLECSDEGTYKCSVEYSLNGLAQPNAEEETNLVLQVPPSKPAISSVPALTDAVSEGEEVEVTCNADVGSTGKGRIQWRLFRGEEPEDVSSGDSRITTNKVARECFDQINSVLKLQLGRQDQNLVVTCFVVNDDFPETTTLPPVCNDQRLCDQTVRVYVHYPVSDSTITVTHDPQDVYHGGSVTLSCRADGYPVPTYVWLKGNETMNGETGVDGISRLVLSNLTVDGDSGLYTCVAINSPKGAVTTVNKTINITVSPTSPPPTVPTTQPTTTSTTEDGTAEKNTGGGGGDDDTVIIVVVVVVVVVVVIIVVVAVILYRKKTGKKSVEEPPAKPVSNANFNHAFVQPDLVADEKIRTPSLNNSFDVKNEEGLTYATLTYDNRPRSRKPLALGEDASDYSDIQMPHV